MFSFGCKTGKDKENNNKEAAAGPLSFETQVTYQVPNGS
jgi:hypothetical protein